MYSYRWANQGAPFSASFSNQNGRVQVGSSMGAGIAEGKYGIMLFDRIGSKDVFAAFFLKVTYNN